MDERKCHFSFVHVGAPWFAHPVVSTKVQQVVNQLESDSEFHSKSFQTTGLFFFKARDQSSSVAARCKRACRLAANDGKVVFGRGCEV